MSDQVVNNRSETTKVIVVRGGEENRGDSDDTADSQLTTPTQLLLARGLA